MLKYSCSPRPAEAEVGLVVRLIKGRCCGDGAGANLLLPRKRKVFNSKKALTVVLVPVRAGAAKIKPNCCSSAAVT